MTTTVTVIPGDGIGPEVTAVTLEILAAAGADLMYDEQIAGMAALEAVANPLPAETLASIRRNGVALKGPLTTPIGTGFHQRRHSQRVRPLRECPAGPDRRSRWPLR
jgi:isocitrate dehydrogenase (NAD+)